jgi:predicted nucleic acid-binding protein
LRHELRRHPIGDRDLLIAAIAVAHRLCVATRIVREFRCVAGLEVEDWNR